MTGADSNGATRPAWIEALATVSRPGRRVARSLLHRIEGLLHPWRRRRAASALRLRLPVERTLILCYGNICRSPYAEYRLRKKLSAKVAGVDLDMDIASAGFFGPDRRSPEAAVQAAGERGIDLAPHRSQLATPALVVGQDLVLVMTRKQARDARKAFPDAFVLHLGDLDPGIPSQRDIPDPYGHSPKFFAEVYARIDLTLDTLVDLTHPSILTQHPS